MGVRVDGGGILHRSTGRKGLRRDGGASTVEYAAIIVLVAALAAAIGFVVLPERVQTNTTAAICRLFGRDGGKGCPDVKATAAPVSAPTPGTTPDLPLPTPTGGTTRPGTDPVTAGLDPNDPDVQKYNNAKTENANADQAVNDAQGGADEVLKQIKDFLLDVVGWTDLQKCIKSGDIVACINTLINVVPWGKVFKLLKKIPGAIKLAKRLKDLWETVSGAKKRKEAAEKALKEADDILKKKPRKPSVCTLKKPSSVGLRQISGKPLQSHSIAHKLRAANACWEADPEVLDEIFDDFGPDISQGVEYNIARFNEGATNHALNGVGTDPRRLAEYLRGIRDRGFTHTDTKTGNGIFYDETNQVLVIHTPQDVHAYNLTKDEWADLLKKGRYTEN